MAFPWELNLDHSYRDEKWHFPEPALGESTDSVFGSSAEKLDESADPKDRHGTAEHSDARSPATRTPRQRL
jgi:hypothetical protein